LCEEIRKKLENIESLRDSNPLDFLLQREIEFFSQDHQAFLSIHFLEILKEKADKFDYIPTKVDISPKSQISIVSPFQTVPIVMVDRYTPLPLPTNLHYLRQGYDQRLKQFGAEGDITTQQHLDRFLYFCDLEDVDYEDVKMRLFAQSLGGEAKKWFRTLPTGSILNSHHFEQIFLNKWQEKKNPLQMLTQYNQLKRGNDEIVKSFYDRFKRTYNSLPDECKPHDGMAKIHYVEGFDDDFALLLRERRSSTLVDMMNDAIEVEVNLMASRKGKYRFETKKVKEEAQSSTSQPTIDSKLDYMLKVMEKSWRDLVSMTNMLLRNKMNHILEIQTLDNLSNKVFHHLIFYKEGRGIKIRIKMIKLDLPFRKIC
jgi:hypothetical protein